MAYTLSNKCITYFVNGQLEFNSYLSSKTYVVTCFLEHRVQCSSKLLGTYRG